MSARVVPSKEVSAQRAVRAAVQSRQFDPVYYLHGDDDYLKDDAIRELLDAAIDPGTRDFNCEIRRAADLDADTLGSLLNTPPMLAERRAVVLRDVTDLKKAPRLQLDRYLARPAADTLLLLVSPAGAKADTGLESASTSLLFAPLTPERVRRWIVYHADTALQVDIADDAVELLQHAVGSDLHLLAAELDKCASYVLGAGERSPDERASIDAEAVSAVVGVRRGETVIDLLDAVARQDAKAATALVGFVLGQPKVSAVQVVILLSTQALALAFGSARREAGLPSHRLKQEYLTFLKETGGFPGRPWGEAISAWTRVSDLWTRERCDRALAMLLEADIALKETSVSNAEQILMSLVLGLCATQTLARSAA